LHHNSGGYFNRPSGTARSSGFSVPAINRGAILKRPSGARASRLLAILISLLSLTGCWTSSGPEVVVYTALDEEFSQPIFADFTKTTGIAVLPKFDAESTKTAGLAREIVEEANRPRCDVFWNNEIILTLRLARQGLLDVYRPKIAGRYPAMYRSKDGLWHGLAARARILLVNTQRTPKDQWPQSITDLTNAKWKGRIGMAKPLFGTTATHAACLFAAWGDEKAREFFDKLKANEVKILSGNKQVAQAVSSGEIDFGITDTDDAYEEIQAARPVEIVYPDQAAGQIGTLYIPNTLAVIKGAPHAAEARRLVDYILSPEVEARLALGPSAQVPLNPDVTAQPPIKTPRTIRAMQVDFEKAAAKWDDVARFLRERFAL
jgi:iron(III) transport system substrate-binding protein